MSELRSSTEHRMRTCSRFDLVSFGRTLHGANHMQASTLSESMVLWIIWSHRNPAILLLVHRLKTAEGSGPVVVVVPITLRLSASYRMNTATAVEAASLTSQRNTKCRQELSHETTMFYSAEESPINGTRGMPGSMVRSLRQYGASEVKRFSSSSAELTFLTTARDAFLHHFPALIADNLKKYFTVSANSHKKLITEDIVSTILQLGGRFLKMDKAQKGWVQISKEAARIKVAQALQYRQSQSAQDIPGARMKTLPTESPSSQQHNGAQPKKAYIIESPTLLQKETGSTVRLLDHQPLPEETRDPEDKTHWEDIGKSHARGGLGSWSNISISSTTIGMPAGFLKE